MLLFQYVDKKFFWVIFLDKLYFTCLIASYSYWQGDEEDRVDAYGKGSWT